MTNINTKGEAGALNLQDRLYDGLTHESSIGEAFGPEASAETTFYPNGDTEVHVAFSGYDGQPFHGRGFAFLREGDIYDPSIGRSLAFGRAIQDALTEAETIRIGQVQGADNVSPECDGNCCCPDPDDADIIPLGNDLFDLRTDVRALTGAVTDLVNILDRPIGAFS